MLKEKDVVNAPNKKDELVPHEVIDYNNRQFVVLQNLSDENQRIVLEYIHDSEHDDQYLRYCESIELFALNK